MHSDLRHIALTLVVTLVTAVALIAAREMPQGRGMMDGQGEMMGPRYDKSAEVTVTAVIKEVKLMTPGDAMGGMQGQGGMGAGRMAGAGPMGGVHLVVDADGTPMEVMLGPQSFLTEQKYTFDIGDRLTITGVRTKRGETEMIAPRLIKRGDTTMTFRDENGRPLWAGPQGGAS
jgi:hypothetical protein